MSYKLPKLPYDYDALEPHIDERTMKIHHTKHHQGYTDKVNKALEGHKFADMPISDVLKRINEVPEDIRQSVINNGGGYANHKLFWTILSPNGGGEPTGALYGVTSMLLKLVLSRPNSSSDWTSVSTCRSPSETCWAAASNSRTGLLMVRAMNNATPIASSSESADPANSSNVALLLALVTISSACSARACS